jgi:hypothetical protein
MCENVLYFSKNDQNGGVYTFYFQSRCNVHQNTTTDMKIEAIFISVVGISLFDLSGKSILIYLLVKQIIVDCHPKV